MKLQPKHLSLAGLCLLCAAWAALSQAEVSRPGEAETGRAADWAFKFTPAYYATTHQRDAVDLNLRANHGPHAAWLGYYRRGNEFEQTRVGYEYTAAMPFGKLVPSVVLASRGFSGGSINAEIEIGRASCRERVYVLV